MKAILCNSPVLAAPQFDKPFELQMDASFVGAVAVLLQEDDVAVDLRDLCVSFPRSLTNTN